MAFKKYRDARDRLIANPVPLLRLEEFISGSIVDLIDEFADEAESDYNAASILYPFWKNYPPDERGRQPRGDQFPWIEVGEHSIGAKISRAVVRDFAVSDLGFPTGADQRFILRSKAIGAATRGLTDSVWVCIDIKSVGPRDDSPHAVMSHNQVSGSGEWTTPDDGIRNNTMLARRTARASHDFYPAMPPLLVLPDGRLAPTITMVVKPVYAMTPDEMDAGNWSGQPLSRIDCVTIPNGLLLTQNPNYLVQHPGLLFPGKDDKTRPSHKLRARVDFQILKSIAAWRWVRVWPRQLLVPEA